MTDVVMSSNKPYLIRAMHEWITDNGLTPYLLVNAHLAPLDVPPNAIVDGRIVLNVAYRAVMNLELGNEYISFSARFGGVSRDIVFPVGAVLAIYCHENGQGMAMPEEPAHAEPEGATVHLAVVEDDAPTAAAALKAVPADTSDEISDHASEDSAQDNDDDPKPPPRGKPSLRVIK